jgi:ribosomal protein S18 acetylase RimI-like enzyme
MDHVLSAETRALRPSDLDAVVALDARVSGRARRGYFEKRLAAALRAPELHVQAGAEEGGALSGFAMCRLRQGEFGRAGPVAALEALAVDPRAQGRGIARGLLAACRAVLARKGVERIATQAEWRNHSLLRFLDASGFALAPRQVIGLDLAGGRELLDSGGAGEPEEAPGEIDYSRPAARDGEPFARDRVPVRSLRAEDLPALIAIEREGAGRRAELAAKLDEALLESGVRVSLLAEIDGSAAGYLTAKVDFGEFGRTEPVAMLDAITVRPEFRRRGVASALLSQLGLNLAALNVERVETEISRENFDLLGLLYKRGFAPSQRLAFERAV